MCAATALANKAKMLKARQAKAEKSALRRKMQADDKALSGTVARGRQGGTSRRAAAAEQKMSHHQQQQQQQQQSEDSGVAKGLANGHGNDVAQGSEDTSLSGADVAPPEVATRAPLTRGRCLPP